MQIFLSCVLSAMQYLGKYEFHQLVTILVIQASVQNLVTRITTVLDNLIVAPDAAELVSMVNVKYM